MGRLLTVVLLNSVLVGFQNCNGLSAFKVKDLNSIAPVVAPFSVNRPQTQVLPLSIRISKIQNLLGVSDSSSLSLIYERKTELGGYDHANGIAVDNSWTETRLALWAKSIQPVCKSQTLQSRFPYPSGVYDFFKSAFGRDTNGNDQALINSVSSSSGDSTTKFVVLCSVVLSSLEFNSL